MKQRKNTPLAEELENYPEDMANGSYLADLMRPNFFESNTEEGAGKDGWTETDTAMRDYCSHVLRLFGLGMDAAQTEDPKAENPKAEKILKLVHEPFRMIRILLLAMAVKECRGFSNCHDPLFCAAIHVAKLRAGGMHPKDIVFWHQRMESDAKESAARFSDALARVIGKKTGDHPTYCRLYSALFYRIQNGLWPTLADIETTANELFAPEQFFAGDNTWLRFRKRHRLYWLTADKVGRKKNATISADNRKRTGK